MKKIRRITVSRSPSKLRFTSVSYKEEVTLIPKSVGTEMILTYINVRSREEVY